MSSNEALQPLPRSECQMSTRFGFVVLNYVNHQETTECVETILRLADDNYRVVVVDNHSPNDSFPVLSDRFGRDRRVTVVQSGRNGGYSFGNNVGIRALRKQGISNVIIATSDTRIEGSNILERCEIARRTGVAVVGPYVRDLNDAPQNPVLRKLSLRYIVALHLGAPWEFLKSLALRSAFGRRLKERETAESTGRAEAPADVYMVHGCFLYLSEHYLRRFPVLDEDLFMYGEEDVISYNCIRSNLRIVYDPTIRTHHRDAQSTSHENDFRGRTLSGSLATLKLKVSFTGLVHAYIFRRTR
jgi:GT2 family glycosyltransferase